MSHSITPLKSNIVDSHIARLYLKKHDVRDSDLTVKRVQHQRKKVVQQIVENGQNVSIMKAGVTWSDVLKGKEGHFSTGNLILHFL